MAERKLSPPFLVQMCSGEFFHHCDKYPHGSIHEVQKDENGNLWQSVGVDYIPTEFKTIVLDTKPEIKVCPSCKREFPSDWPFATWRENKKHETSCVRCYERHHIEHKHGFTTDDYRSAVREELKRELGIK